MQALMRLCWLTVLGVVVFSMLTAAGAGTGDGHPGAVADAPGAAGAPTLHAVHPRPGATWQLGAPFFRERTSEAVSVFLKSMLTVFAISVVLLGAAWIAASQNPGASCGLGCLGATLLAATVAFTANHLPFMLLGTSPHAEAEFVVTHPTAAAAGMCWLLRWKYSDPPISFIPAGSEPAGQDSAEAAAGAAVPYVDGSDGHTLFHAAFEAGASGEGACIDAVAEDTTAWVFSTVSREHDPVAGVAAGARALESYCDTVDPLSGRSVRDVAPGSFCDASLWRRAALAETARQREDVLALIRRFAEEHYDYKPHWQPKLVEVVNHCQPFASYGWRTLEDDFVEALASPAAVEALGVGFGDCFSKGHTQTEGSTEVTVIFCNENQCQERGAALAAEMSERVPVYRQRLVSKVDAALDFLELPSSGEAARRSSGDDGTRAQPKDAEL